MTMIPIYLVLFISSACFADDDNEWNEAQDEVAKGLSNFFKDAAESAKQKSEESLGMFKGLSGSMFGQFGEAKEKLEEHGLKMKATAEESAAKVKDEIESAASNISDQGKKAMDFMKTLFSNK